MADRPPNVLMIIDDEHRPDVLGYAGDDVVRTPTLDRLASDAVVFDNAYTPSPRCVPARQCLALGEYPRTCGVEVYGQDLPPESETFARQFTEAGYETVACGKLHHRGKDQMQGYLKRIGNHNRSADTYDRSTTYESTVSDGKWLQAKEVARAGPGRARNRVGDEYAVLGAENFIEQHFLDPYYDRATPDVPLFLNLGLSQPHYPYYCEEELFEYYLNRVEPYVEDPPEHRMLRGHWEEGYTVVPEEDVTVRELTRATAAYYAMIETVDGYVDRILQSLEQAGEDLDEWIIIFTSDHGEMLGQHGTWEKGRYYEASAGVPLFIRWPERFDHHRVTRNVNLVDLYATLCDLADVPVPTDEPVARDSRRLTPLLRGDTDEWDRRHPHDETISAEGDSLMIKRRDEKYMWFGDGPKSVEAPEVLFDLDSDPGETTNLVGSPEKSESMETFRARRRELGYGVESA